MSIECKTFSGPDLFGYVASPKAGVRGGVLILPAIFGVNGVFHASNVILDWAESGRRRALKAA